MRRDLTELGKAIRAHREANLDGSFARVGRGEPKGTTPRDVTRRRRHHARLETQALEAHETALEKAQSDPVWGVNGKLSKRRAR